MSLIVADYCNCQSYKSCFFDVLCWFVWSWMNFILRRGFESRGFAMPTDLRLMKSSPATRCSASASLGTKSTGVPNIVCIHESLHFSARFWMLRSERNHFSDSTLRFVSMCEGCVWSSSIRSMFEAKSS